jgi:hypothetical protein
MIILGTLLRIQPYVHAQGGTVVSVVNPVNGGNSFTFPPETPINSTFVANMTVSNVTHLATWQINITWNPTLLRIVNTGYNADISVPTANVFGAYADIINPTVNNYRGNAFQMVGIKSGGPAYVNVINGTLCQIRFTILKNGTGSPPLNCSIHIVTQSEYPIYTSLIDDMAEDIPYTPFDASYTMLPVQYALTLNIVGSGSVTKVPDQSIFNFGTNVTLTANPAVGWRFDHWSGDASGSVNPITINMTSDKVITATFTQITYALTVTPVGSGSASLNNSGPYHYGDIVELTAVPAVGWSFDHWAGDLTGSTNPATILIDGNKDVTAYFTQDVYTLTVDTVGNGSVDLNDTGPYNYGDVVQATANPAADWSLDHWELDGTDVGSTNPYAVLMDTDHTLTAFFNTVGFHDVAVTNITTWKTVVAQGNTVSINITVENHGDFEESFNVTVYANQTAIGTVTHVTLAIGDSTTLTIAWNTSTFARAYEIGAEATLSYPDDQPSDNRLVFGIVKVSCAGDVNGDYVTSAKDFVLVKKAIPSLPGSPKWNPNADMNDDGVMDAKDYQLVKSYIPSIFP